MQILKLLQLFSMLFVFFITLSLVSCDNGSMSDKTLLEMDIKGQNGEEAEAQSQITVKNRLRDPTQEAVVLKTLELIRDNILWLDDELQEDESFIPEVLLPLLEHANRDIVVLAARTLK